MFSFYDPLSIICHGTREGVKRGRTKFWGMMDVLTILIVWWWFPEYIHMSTFIKLCTLNMSSLLYINYISILIFFKATTLLQETIDIFSKFQRWLHGYFALPVILRTFTQLARVGRRILPFHASQFHQFSQPWRFSPNQTRLVLHMCLSLFS